MLMFTPVRVGFREMKVFARSYVVRMNAVVGSQVEVEIDYSIGAFIDEDTTMFISARRES